MMDDKHAFKPDPLSDRHCEVCKCGREHPVHDTGAIATQQGKPDTQGALDGFKRVFNTDTQGSV